MNPTCCSDLYIKDKHSQAIQLVKTKPQTHMAHTLDSAPQSKYQTSSGVQLPTSLWSLTLALQSDMAAHV